MFSYLQRISTLLRFEGRKSRRRKRDLAIGDTIFSYHITHPLQKQMKLHIIVLTQEMYASGTSLCHFFTPMHTNVTMTYFTDVEAFIKYAFLRGEKPGDILLIDTSFIKESISKICSDIRELFKASDIPIIIMVKGPFDENIEDGLRSGANDFIFRPLNMMQIVQRSFVWLTWKGLIGGGSQSSLTSTPMSPNSSSSVSNIRMERFECITCLCANICGFHEFLRSEETGLIVKILNDITMTFDELYNDWDCMRLNSLGDTYLVVCGHTQQHLIDHASYLWKLGALMITTMERWHRYGLGLFVGLHTGCAVGGFIGKNPEYIMIGESIFGSLELKSYGYRNNMFLSMPCWSCLTDDDKLEFVKLKVKNKEIFAHIGGDLKEIPRTLSVVKCPCQTFKNEDMFD